jgi:hypothetical protein
MAYDPSDYAGFSVQGLRAMRLNNDGTIPTPARTIAGLGPFDIGTALGGTTGDLTIKKDGVIETKTVAFLGAADINAVTVDEAVTALTTAAFTGMTFSKEVGDVGKDRLKAVSAGGETYIQIYNEVALVLEFGQGLGLKFVKAFDETVSVQNSKNVKDFEEVESEAGDGTLKSVIVDAKLKGVNPVLTFNSENYPMKELIEGGTWDSVNFTYDPPTSDQDELPGFFMETYQYKYAEGINQRSDQKSVKKRLYRNCRGLEGDTTDAAKVWTEIIFNLRVTEYFDATGARFAPYQDSELTNEEYEALDVVNI